ncbi:MAG: MoaD/ThiS family protein [Rhodospirillaceae bacterium]
MESISAMKVIVKLISMEPFSPYGFDDKGVGKLTLADGADLADAITAMKLPDGVGESYMTMLNDDAVAISERVGVMLNEGDEITIFPAIKGG